MILDYKTDSTSWPDYLTSSNYIPQVALYAHAAEKILKARGSGFYNLSYCRKEVEVDWRAYLSRISRADILALAENAT